MSWRVLRAFWAELNRPDSFEGKPYFAFINQIGHIALGRHLVENISAVLVQIFGGAPNAWAIAIWVVAGYVLLVELNRQGWVGADTIRDSAFLALGAVCLPITASVTPSGRWIRVDEASGNYLIWQIAVLVAVVVYMRPRLIAAYGGDK
jgi:hypothetical protein